MINIVAYVAFGHISWLSVSLVPAQKVYQVYITTGCNKTTDKLAQKL